MRKASAFTVVPADTRAGHVRANRSPLHVLPTVFVLASLSAGSIPASGLLIAKLLITWWLV